MICINDKDFCMDGNTVVTFGKFDGIHKGHRMLIENAKRIAYENNLKVVVFTFRVVEGRHYPYMDEQFINSFHEREILFDRMNADVLIEYPFDDDTANMEPLEFIKEIVVKKLHAKYVLVGEDWTFGKGGQGNSDLLKAAGKLFDYNAVIFDKLTHDDKEIGSTWVKEEIRAGNMATVSILLNYPYTIIGKVVKGNQLGRTTDFPTANIEPDVGKILPPFGVYASRIYVAGRAYYGITNIGKKPTVSVDDTVTIENYIFDFEGDIYGEDIEIQLILFERPEMKFEDIISLKNQIKKDEEFTRDFFLLKGEHK